MDAGHRTDKQYCRRNPELSVRYSFGVKNYVNCHQHGVYSFLDGYAKYEPLVDRAIELGMPALSITEHGNLHGLLDFYDACTKRERPIKPILGYEAYQARKTRFDRDEEERAGRATDELEQRGPYHLTILARNMVGYKNLIKLSSRSYLEGFYVKPRIDYELLAEHADGLTVLSGCLGGAVQQALLRRDGAGALAAATRLQDIVGKDHFFMEIQDHGIPEQKEIQAETIALAQRLDAPLVPSCDAHYIRQEDALSHDVMLCIGTRVLMSQEHRFKFYNNEFYLKSYAEMEQRFPSEWLAHSLTVADQVELELDYGELYFPDFDIPGGEDINTYLPRLVEAGLKERYGDPLPTEVMERYHYEMGVVARMGFQSYFLVVADIVNWARSQKIRVGFGRGSAAGSILSYALRITNLDPLRFGLNFDRFLVEGRKSMPDIDLDFDDRYRDQVIDYARQKYGTEKVANIATFTTLGSRSSIRDAGRVLGYDVALTDRLSKLVPPPVLGVSKSIEESLLAPEMAKAYQTEPAAKEIIDIAKGLEGIFRQPGIHAAGIVISRTAMTDYIPVMRMGDKGPVVTQWSYGRVEEIGLLKIDFLGLRNLGVVDRAVALIKDRHGLDIDLDNNFPLDDPLVFQKLQEGLSMGIFQIEGEGMKTMMNALRPDSIDDLMALVALYRPGPLGAHLDKLYIDRKHGKEIVTYDHPALQIILGHRYGTMLYQEDVLLVARQLAGFSVGEADDLRKAIGKKQMDKIGFLRTKFVEGCAATHNVDPSVANKIYSNIEFFGGYGFPLAHAASYGILTYITAWLKFRYPIEYMTALLSSVYGNRDKGVEYLNECRRMELTVSPPSINSSAADFKVASDTEILFGLHSVEGIGDHVVEALVAGDHDFVSVWDFLRRIRPEILNKGVIEHLVFSGALDELVPDQPPRLLSRSEKMELLDFERRELGLYVSDHPLTGAWKLVETGITHTIEAAHDLTPDSLVRVGGMLSKVSERITRRGDQMYTLTIEDPTGFMGVLVFPNVARNLPPGFFVEGSIVWIEGRLMKDNEEDKSFKLKLQIKTDVPIPLFDLGPPIILHFPESPSLAILEEIAALIETTPGSSPVYIEFPEGRHLISLRMKKPTALSLQSTLETITLRERIGL